jgi:hypothetical protein
MTSSTTRTPKRAAALFGAAFAIVFLFTYDPDELPSGLLNVSRWLVLLPATFLLTWRSARAWLTGLVLTGGVFFGVCFAAILYGSNIWPIAGVFWTWALLPPIVVGTVAGVLIGSMSNRAGSELPRRGPHRGRR